MYMTNLAEVLRSKRERAHLTQDQLGKRLGFEGAQYISNCERGLCSLSPKKWKEAARILDCPAVAFLNAFMKDSEVKLRKVLK
jgi:transcriptional regulator with XRE-family HTH domain